MAEIFCQGTPDFISAEINVSGYKYRPFIPPDPNNESSSYSFDGRRTGFWANYLHDLESLWWILVWTNTHFLKASDFESKSPAYELEKKKKDAINEMLFSHTKILMEREYFFSSNGSHYKHLGKVPNSFPNLRHVVKVMRKMLLFTYFMREEEMDDTIPILVSDDCSLHIDCLEQLRSHPWEDIKIIPIWEATSNGTNAIPDRRQSVERRMEDEKAEDDEK